MAKRIVKHLKRRCDLPRCRKEYRYAQPTSKYCSVSCRQAGARLRRASRTEAEAAADLVNIRAMAKHIVERPKIGTQVAQQIAPPAPARAPKPADECECVGKDFGHFPACPLNTDPTRRQTRAAVRITIHNVPKRFPGTPLTRRYSSA